MLDDPLNDPQRAWRVAFREELDPRSFSPFPVRFDGQPPGDGKT